jgi:microcystin-dependent protein
MATQAQQVNISQLPPASLLYNGDVFAVDQMGGDGYTKQVSFSTLYRSISSIILPDLYNIKVNKSGDTMTGHLTLTGNPITALNAATKQYVDTQDTLYISNVKSAFLPLSGGIMTGSLTLPGNPTSALNAATKQYVDAAVGTGSYAVPTGAIFWFVGQTAPTGYLICNGDDVTNGFGLVQGVSANYSALYALLSATYGNAGSLPDLRGEFIRGWSSAGGTQRANVDTGRVFGSSQVDQVGEHNLSVRALESSTEFAARYLSSRTALAAGFVAASPNAYTDSFASSPPSNSITRTPNQNIQLQGVETRPRNIALLPCIKY